MEKYINGKDPVMTATIRVLIEDNKKLEIKMERIEKENASLMGRLQRLEQILLDPTSTY